MPVFEWFTGKERIKEKRERKRERVHAQLLPDFSKRVDSLTTNTLAVVDTNQHLTNFCWSIR